MKPEVDYTRTTKIAIFNRLFLLIIGFSTWITIILIRLFFLQALDYEEYVAQSESQQKAFIEVSSKRGDILDRNLEELAISVPAESVYADPQQIEDPVKVAATLAPLLEISKESLLAVLQSRNRFTYLKRKIPPKLGQQIRDLQLAGIGIQKESGRAYPNRELAAHILGFVGMDGEGLGGLEYFFNKYLEGKKTRIDMRVDALRNPFERSPSIDVAQGDTLVLTLDKTIQHIAENSLREAIEKAKAKNGSVIVMNPHNGDILAMASYPFFNPNNHQESPSDHRRNRPILDIYEPGSTFKIITLSSVLNESLGFPDEVIDCRVGTARIANKVYKEAKGSYQDLTITEIFAKSSNVGTVKLGLRLGPEMLHQYVRNFGFGQKTGIDLPGEELGIFRPTTSWSKISIGAVSIGQEIAVTPLQLIRAAAAVANGGFLVKPRIVQRIASPEGDTLLEYEPQRTRILNPETVEMMKRIMTQTVLEGTGRISRLKGYSSAGKTGTAQKIVNGNYSKSHYVASFVGFAPVENPALISLVVVNEPKGVTYGGPVAGPAFKEIMERSLLYQKVPKSNLDDIEKAGLMIAYNDENDQNEPSALPEVFSNQLEPQLQKDLEIKSTLDDGNSVVKDNQIVTVSIGNRRMPDLTGKTLRQVAAECFRLGIQPKITGKGIAVGQRPAPGSPISQNMVCEVFFSTEKPNETRKNVVDDSGRADSRVSLE